MTERVTRKEMLMLYCAYTWCFLGARHGLIGATELSKWVENKQAADVLSRRFGIPTEIILKDHMPPITSFDTTLVGELGELEHMYAAQNGAGYKNNAAGFEVATEERAAMYNEALGSAGLLFSTDSESKSTFLEKYAERLSGSISDADIAFHYPLLTYAIAMSLYYSISSKKTLTRREFLKKAANISTIGVADALVKILRVSEQAAEVLATKGMNQLTKDVLKILSLQDQSLLRDLIMVVNTNSLIPLKNIQSSTKKLVFFAGNGHQGAAKLISREPEVVASQLQTDIENLLLRYYELLIKYCDEEGVETDAVQSILAVMGDAVNLFTPVAFRNNIDDTTQLSLDSEKQSYSSVFLVLCRAVKAVQPKLTNVIIRLHTGETLQTKEYFVEKLEEIIKTQLLSKKKLVIENQENITDEQITIADEQVKFYKGHVVI